MYREILQSHPLFAGLDEGALRRALDYFGATQRHYGRGEFINRLTGRLERFGMVLSGGVQVYMDDIDGQQIIMATVGPGDTFGESLCFLEWETPVAICATAESEVLLMRTAMLKAQQPPDRFELMLYNRFTAMLARRALEMNSRIQILSRKTIREKLNVFFSQNVQRYGSSFTLPFNRADMATYLGTDRSALSRELSAMRAEGLLEFERSRFHILKAILY